MRALPLRTFWALAVLILFTVVSRPALAVEETTYLTPGITFTRSLLSNRITVGPSLSVNFWPKRSQSSDVPAAYLGAFGGIDIGTRWDVRPYAGIQGVLAPGYLELGAGGVFGGGRSDAVRPLALGGAGGSIGILWFGVRAILGAKSVMDVELVGGVGYPIAISGRGFDLRSERGWGW